MFLEPTRLYRLLREEVADDGVALPLDTCFTLREGSDLTLVSWGAMLHETLAAADALAARAWRPRSSTSPPLKPLDHGHHPGASVARTGRGW
jgi:2-oxoisovalerate dehydrogenase E1 component beta subunit